LELPFPIYKAEIDVHTELATLGREAGEIASARIAAGGLSQSLGLKREVVRVELGKTIDKIDRLVARLLK